MRFVVTGGRGFIGRSVCARLAGLGHQVLALDNGWRSDVAVPLGVELVNADIRDGSALKAAFGGADAVVHLAAIQGTRNFYELPQLVLDVNVRGALNVVDAAADAGVRRVVFSSSSEVYGVPETYPTSEAAPLQVPDVLNARWSYGASKIIGELAVVSAARAAQNEFTILRYHNVYGPEMGWDHVIPQFIARLERGLEFTVQGDGEQRRSFCYIDDAADATVAATLETSAAGTILNIGNPSQEVSINELVALLARVSGKQIDPRYVEFEGEGTRRRVPDISRAARILGFEPHVTLEDGLARTYQWYARAIRDGAIPSAA